MNKQFLGFCIVGVSNTIVAYLINITALKLLQQYQLSWDYVIANLISFFLSVLWSFYWNSRFVFTLNENRFLALLKTYISYAVSGIFITNILSYLLIEIFGISKYLAPLFILIISVPINYFLNKKWAFRN